MVLEELLCLELCLNKPGYFLSKDCSLLKEKSTHRKPKCDEVVARLQECVQGSQVLKTGKNEIFGYQSVAHNSRMLYFHWLLD